MSVDMNDVQPVRLSRPSDRRIAYRRALFIVRENPRRAIHLLLWVLTGFILSFGVVLSIWFVRGILWLLGALGG